MRHLFTVIAIALLSAGLLLPVQAMPGDDTVSPNTVAMDDSSDVTLDDGVGVDAEDASLASQADDGPTLDVSVNGSLRFNTLFRAYNTSFEEGNDRILGDGGFTFDTFRIGASGSYGDLIFDAEYAVYPESFGGLFIHHGWVGYEFSDTRQIQVGVNQVPFGIQPYASSSWFFNNTYYVGLEDDYDAGIKALYQGNGWDVQGAYYMNAEQTDFFAGQDFSRYSYDVAPVSSANYQVVPGGNDTRDDLTEEHQFNAKVAYNVDHGALGFTKVGVSGQRGQLTNLNTGETDWHAAYALHLQGRYEGFEAKLQFAQQELNPPVDGDDRFVVMGAYAFPQRVASKHDVYSSSLAYHIPVNTGPISKIKPYYDFSMVTKDVDGWNDNVSHDVGFLTSAGPLFVYTDLNISKGHPFNHPAENFASVMAEQNDNEWRVAFNMNIGVYF